MSDAQIVKVPREAGTELTAVIGRDELGHRPLVSGLVYDIDSGPDRVVGGALQDRVAGEWVVN